MNANSLAEPMAQVQTRLEDASTFIQFINLNGELSKAFFLAMHPEENDEAPRSECDSGTDLSLRFKDPAKGESWVAN